MAITQKGLLTRVTGPLGRTAGGPGIYAWLVAITCAFVNNCPMQTDEGIFHYAGWLWVHKGLPPYVGVVENKGPAIFIVNAISNVLFGVNIWFTRLLGCLFLVGTSWLLYLIGRRLAGKTAGTLAMITFGLAMSWASMNGWVCSLTENFMLGFIVLAFYCLLVSEDSSSSGRRRLALFASGLSMGLAIAFKQIAMLSAVGLLVFLADLNRKKTPPERLWSGMVTLLAGAFVGHAVALLPLIVSGASISDYYQIAWKLLSEMVKPDSASRIDSFVSVFMEGKLALFYLPLLYFVFRRRSVVSAGVPYIGLLVWAGVDFVAANASGYYFGHQLRQMLPSLSLIYGISGAMLWKQIEEAEPLAQQRAWIALLATTVLFFPFKSVVTACRIYGDGPDNTAVILGRWVKAHTKPADYVLFYGRNFEQAQVYSERQSPTRHFNCMFVRVPGVRREIQQQVARHQPQMIIFDRRRSLPSWLKSSLQGYTNHGTYMLYHDHTAPVAIYQIRSQKLEVRGQKSETRS